MGVPVLSTQLIILTTFLLFFWLLNLCKFFILIVFKIANFVVTVSNTTTTYSKSSYKFMFCLQYIYIYNQKICAQRNKPTIFILQTILISFILFLLRGQISS